MKTRYHSKLTKGFAHSVSLSQLEQAIGCPELAVQEVTFTDTEFSNEGNYYHVLERTDQPYAVIGVKYRTLNQGLSVTNKSPSDTYYGDYYGVYVYPVRSRELKQIKVKLGPHLAKIKDWILAPKSRSWLLHSHELILNWNPSTEEIIVEDIDQLPSKIRG